ncbi:pentapeptide repeat-containing protein [Paracoccus sp. (in: a-proteobacteria)]|uniref:pentapeptide repeat-containing protein n=1 Tax=Paracoccus sp. TaxID=267 RepID=UPI00321F9F44
MAEFTRAEILRRIATTGRLHLAGADLAGLDLSGLTMVGADLSYADLTETDLSEAQLAGASLWSARAGAAHFDGANLTGACLGLADLAGASLRSAQLEKADLTGARLDRADLTDAQMRGAWLDAMQRALAIGAPPMRYPAGRVRQPRTRILNEDQLIAPVSLRCGDRLELHLQRRAGHRRGLVRVEGAPVLSLPDPPGTQPGPAHVLAFSAVAPGRARLVLEPGAGGAPITLEVLVTP